MDLLSWITQACTSLSNTISPSVDSMGVHICISLATIMLVWFGVQEALASAQGGSGFSIGKFVSFFMLITFAYVLVKFYDSSIPGVGYSLKGFINGGAQYLVGQIGTDSAANITATLKQAESAEGPGMMSAVLNPYNAIIFALIQVVGYSQFCQSVQSNPAREYTPLLPVSTIQRCQKLQIKLPVVVVSEDYLNIIHAEGMPGFHHPRRAWPTFALSAD